MKYLKKYKKLFEGVGDKLPEDDKFLVLLNDLSLNISDIGFDVIVKGYESYESGINNYQLIIESKDNFEIYDINSGNINDLNKIDTNLEKLNELNSTCKDIIERCIENGLHLCNYYISIKSGVFAHVKFACKSDGSPVDPDYEDDETEDY